METDRAANPDGPCILVNNIVAKALWIPEALRSLPTGFRAVGLRVRLAGS